MITWADFCTRSVRCPRCRKHSPDQPDPDSAITWTDTHDCTTEASTT